ncbi:MAG: rhodanese-like domain-containing protein [Legionellales bacterium]|jgi:rhodanese-related sulfurtransferase|nr:rhodanese-like domain-containing protein [Legionellales bacterium]
MNNILIFISDNYLYLLAISVGYFLSQQDSPLLGLLLGVNYISSQDAVVKSNKDCVMLDIRSVDLYNDTHIAGAQNINLIKKVGNNKKSEKKYIAYNSNGSVSYKEIRILKSYGLDDLTVLQGGINSWIEDGLPVKTRKKND